MENHQQSSILKWFKKYILMRDLKEKSPEVLSSCIKILIIPFLAFYLLMLFYNEITYAHDFTKLDVLDGVVKINHYTQKQGKYGREPVIDIHVVSESKDLIYFRSPIYSSEQPFINSAKIEGQQVRAWYLSDENKFYLIKFLHTNEFNDFKMVRKTQAELIREGNYARFAYPLRVLLVLFVVSILQLQLIRFEIFRNYDLYFINQRWDWQRPVKAVLTVRYFTVVCAFLIWPFLVIYVCI